MKKILLILGITWMVFSSCSKEAGPEESPEFFFFDTKYGSKQVVANGQNSYNAHYSRTIYEGPKYDYDELSDEMVLYVWPDYNGPFKLIVLFRATEPITFYKKGTGIIGEYTIRDTGTTHFSVTNIFFHVVPGSEKLTITKTGEANQGKFAEGTMIFNARIENDTIPVPVTATFRLKKQ